MLAAPGTVKTYQEFDAELYVLTKEEGGRHTPFLNNYRPQVSFPCINSQYGECVADLLFGCACAVLCAHSRCDRIHRPA